MTKKILLVDPLNTFLLMKMMLTHGGFEVVTGRDGVDAIVKAHTEKPDVIVLDAVLPRLSGLTACAAIRRHDETSHIPILIVGQEQNLEAAFSKGCTEFVSKPVHSVELLTKLQRLLLSTDPHALEQECLESHVDGHSA